MVDNLKRVFKCSLAHLVDINVIGKKECISVELLSSLSCQGAIHYYYIEMFNLHRF
jgi:hypothetical protein